MFDANDSLIPQYILKRNVTRYNISHKLDCSQSPTFSWDFRDYSNASIELPPSLFVRASATWGECLNYRGGPSQVTLRSVKNRGTVTTSY